MYKYMSRLFKKKLSKNRIHVFEMTPAEKAEARRRYYFNLNKYR